MGKLDYVMFVHDCGERLGLHSATTTRYNVINAWLDHFGLSMYTIGEASLHWVTFPRSYHHLWLSRAWLGYRKYSRLTGQIIPCYYFGQGFVSSILQVRHRYSTYDWISTPYFLGIWSVLPVPSCPALAALRSVMWSPTSSLTGLAPIGRGKYPFLYAYAGPSCFLRIYYPGGNLASERRRRPPIYIRYIELSLS